MRRVGLLALVAAATATSAAAAPSVSPWLSVSSRTVAAGGTVVFRGGPCRPGGGTVFLISRLFPGRAYGVGAIRTTARADGTFRRPYRIPAATRRRDYAVSVRCGGANLGLTVRLRVR